MQEISLNILDLAQNSLAAGAGLIEITVDERPRDDRIRVCIRDDGRGMTPEQLECAADPFFTTRRVGEGTGLGLHFCREIVQSHRGRLEARSIERGALFTVWLPQGEV